MNRNVLLVIDLQDEFYVQDKTERIEDYIRNSNFDIVVGSVFKNANNENLTKMLNWEDGKNPNPNYISEHYNELIIKTGYTVPIGRLMKYKNDKITVIGCDTESSVLATCFALFDAGFNFVVDVGHIYSSGNIGMHMEAVNIMKRNFGKDVIVLDKSIES